MQLADVMARQLATAARGYMHQDPESSGPEAEARLRPRWSGSVSQQPRYRATRGSMQITLIWTPHWFTVGFEATVHIGGSSAIRLVTRVGKSRVNQSLRAGWRVQAAIDRARLRRAEASTP